jgi:hypothetical protein
MYLMNRLERVSRTIIDRCQPFACLQRTTAAQQMVEGRCHGKQIAAGIGAFIQDLLRGSIVGCPGYHTVIATGRCGDIRSPFGNAKIKQHNPLAFGKLQVLGLDVTVNHWLMAGMEIVKHTKQLVGPTHHPVKRQRALFVDKLVKVFAFDILHHDKVRVTIAKAFDDIGKRFVLQVRQELRLVFQGCA